MNRLDRSRWGGAVPSLEPVQKFRPRLLGLYRMRYDGRSYDGMGAHDIICQAGYQVDAGIVRHLDVFPFAFENYEVTMAVVSMEGCPSPITDSVLRGNASRFGLKEPTTGDAVLFGAENVNVVMDGAITPSEGGSPVVVPHAPFWGFVSVFGKATRGGVTRPSFTLSTVMEEWGGGCRFLYRVADERKLKGLGLATA